MNEANFLSFIARERLRFVHYVRSLLNEAAAMEAEDLVQDVLLRILERPDSTPPLENLAAYVYRSLRNRVIDAGRTRKPLVSLDGESAEAMALIDLLKDMGSDPVATIQQHESRERLFSALDVLSDIERKVVIAHEFEGMPFKALSEAWQMPQNTLLSHKARAIKKLRKELLED